MYSKSLFNQNVNMTRTVMNPVGIPNSGVGGLIFTSETQQAIKAIQEYYTWNLANKTYTLIPTDYDKFLHLYYIIHSTIGKISNKNLKLLFQITEDGLQGAMNAYGLNFSNTDLTVQNTMLQQKIDEILSGKNVKNAFDKNTGQLRLQKSFKLAPLFSYYIMLYGMPEPGVGFDQAKLALLLSILEKYCIDPYN
jgi:hypothetical protein